MAAIEQENSHGGLASGRCAGTTKAGEACRSKPAPGSEFCIFHAEDHQEVSRRGGEVSGARRSVRERFREDAERVYPVIWESLLQAVDSEVVGWGDCPKCKHRVAVTFPDIRARTQAIQVLLDQGYGKPAITIREAEPDLPMPWEGMSPEQHEQLLKQATMELERRKTQTPQERIAELETRLSELKAQANGSG